MVSRDSTGHGSLRSVLVPTDFSKGAELALRRALLLPLAPRAKVDLLHVLPPDLPAKLRAQATADAKHALGEIVARTRKAIGERVTVVPDVRAGEAFVEIIRRSRSLDAQLVVLGRHGRRTIRDRFISTTAERVVRKGDVPVLVVNTPAAHPYRHPLVATDLGDSSTRTIELALQVIGPSSATIHVAHACHIPFEGFVTPTRAGKQTSEYRRTLQQRARGELDRLLARFADRGVQWKSSVRVGDARSVLLGEIVRQRADVIALGTHGRSGVAHALIGSVAEWVIEAAPCDVLVARPVRFSFEAP